eukprot:705605-Prymnesium_polylepis.1
MGVTDCTDYRSLSLDFGSGARCARPLTPCCRSTRLPPPPPAAWPPPAPPPPCAPRRSSCRRYVGAPGGVLRTYGS